MSQPRLSKLVTDRREQLGLSLQDVADRSGGLVSKTHVGTIERETLRVPGERVLRGLALALELPPAQVFTAADLSARRLPPFRLPERADRLTARERKVIVTMVDALLAARDGKK